MKAGALHSPQPTPEWDAIPLADLRGVVMIVGAPDTGKSTFARYLYARLREAGKRPAFLDGDPGQASLGPPTTLTLALGELTSPSRTRRTFIGDVSPRGHMLPMLVGVHRLAEAAREAGAEVVVYDTDGLVSPAQGGLALKHALVDLLRPSLVIGIQAEDELEPLLLPLRRSRRTRVRTLRPSPLVQKRDFATRRQNRLDRYAAYFATVHPLELSWREMPVFPWPRFALHGLLAFEDAEGFTRALGIVQEIHRETMRLRVLTPLPSLEGVDALHLGDLALDPQTFREQR
ncbi:MAG: hypothetical protein D6770_05400 [Anaerolineae bacterium]|nr:MAG: hypothetical protein D6770_05400 [Anaerolineae bacterium]